MPDHAAPPEASAGERLTPSRPWPGLASFAESDRDFFRGRERESDELARLVRREALTVLFGRSGLGKTSLLAAGLFPRLREDLYLPVLIRLAHGAALPLREQIWQALAASCSAAGVDATEPQPGAPLWEHFHRAGAGFWNARNRAMTPVLVFDQFEELFTLGQADDATRQRAAEFVAELADLVEDRPPPALAQALEGDPALAERIDFRRRGCKVVLSFREDFLAEMESLRDRMPSLMRNRYRLLPMDGHQAREVVDGGGALLAGGVAERIIGLAWRNRAEAPAENDYERMEVDPALLSVICSELNLRRIAQGSDRIGAELLAGAEREILVDFYERSLKDLDPRVRVFVEDELITEAGFRDSHAFDDALALPGVTRAAIDHLVEGRLLRVDDRFGVRRLELTHDVLTRVVKDSRDARQAREAEAAAAERERDALAVQQRNRRNTAWIALAGVCALLLLVGAGAMAWYAEAAIEREAQAEADAKAAVAAAAAASAALARMTREAAKATDDARKATRVAEESEARAAELAVSAAQEAARAAQQLRDSRITDLMANARGQSSRPELGLLLGAEAVRRSPERLDAQVGQLARLIANEAVYARLTPGAVLRIGDSVHEASEVEFNRSGSALATASLGADDAHFWNAARGVHMRKLENFARAEFSPDGTHVGVQRHDDNLELVAVLGSKPVLVVPPVAGSSVVGIAISRDNRLAVARSDGSIRIHPVGTPPIEVAGAGKTKVTDIAFSPDDRVLAAAGGDGIVRLYRFGAGARVTELVDPEHARGRVLKLVFSPDGRLLASGDADRFALVHDVASRQVVARFGPHEWEVDRLVFVGNGEALVSGQAKGGRDVWDVRKGSRLSRLRDAARTIVDSVDISPHGQRVAVLRTDGTVSLRSWDAKSLLRDTCAIANRNLSCTEWRQYGSGLPYQPTCPALPAPTCP